MHECAECLSTEENPYSTSLCKSHQIELQMQLLEDCENAQQSVQRIGYQTAVIPCPHCGVNIYTDSDIFTSIVTDANR